MDELGKNFLSYWECSLNSPQSSCYSRFDALVVGWGLVSVVSLYSFLASVIGNNCSKVDQLWSILPPLYCWHFFYHDWVVNGQPNSRALLICCITTLWGIRLTFNFWRKGGYGNLIHHEEDYRWEIIRKKIGNSFLFLIFNITFISAYQNILLFWIAAPIHEVISSSVRTVDWKDALVAALFLFLLLMETVADEQHWSFHTLKKRLSPQARESHPNKDIRDGFYRSGLFKYSRHPNYFAEQAMWVTIFLFSCREGRFWNWTILDLLGCFQLILLFQGSMNFGESISASKYPKYRDYQQTTSQCIPWLPSTLPKKTD